MLGFGQTSSNYVYSSNNKNCVNININTNINNKNIKSNN